MIYNELNGEHLSPEKIAQYLARLAMEPPQKLDLAYLSQLQFAHMSHIPYENLDILAGKLTSLNRDVLFNKIIENNRGGVCSELNTLFNWLLESLGFEVISYSTRIIAKSALIQAQTHRAMGVIIDGQTYLTDVGVNYEHHRIPLLLKENFLQTDGECQYQFTRDEFWGWVLWQGLPEGKWRKILGFTEEPHIDLDYVASTFFADRHPDSFINKMAKVSQYLDGTFHAIRSNNYLVTHHGIEEIITPISSIQQEKQLLKDVFGITVQY